jgi:putative restriction endonuclease
MQDLPADRKGIAVADQELRAAAFAALHRITAATGGVITRDQMTAGFTFGNEAIPFAVERKGIWRPRQIGAGGSALSVTTAAIKKGVTPRYDDQVGSDDGWFEYRYQGADPNAWENVAVRTAMRDRTPLIYFYGIVPGLFEAFWPVYVESDEPDRLTFHLAVDAISVGAPSLFEGGSTAPLKAYATVTAKRRIHQARFRELVLDAYANRCTICRFRKTPLLDAAHIIPDRDQRGLPEVPNGLSLCRIHHGAYDLGILGIAPDYRVHIRHDVLHEKDGPMLLHGIQQMDGAKLVLPRKAECVPKAEYLAERFKGFLAA